MDQEILGTLERLEKVRSTVLRTDELGAIKLTFDDDGIKCYSYVYNLKNFRCTYELKT